MDKEEDDGLFSLLGEEAVPGRVGKAAIQCEGEGRYHPPIEPRENWR